MDATNYAASLPILRVVTESTLQMPTSGVLCSLVTGPTPVLCSLSEITVEIPTGQVYALSVNELEHNETCANTLPHNDPPMLVLNARANDVEKWPEASW
jgi:hypothetical protein